MVTISNSVILYALIVSLVGFALASIAIWSRRDVRMRLTAIVLALVAAPVAWYAFSELPGKPDGISTDDFRADYHCATILPYPDIQEEIGLFMLVKKKNKREPEYLFVEWNLKLASSLQKSVRDATTKGQGSIVYGGESCKDDGEAGEKGKSKGQGKSEKVKDQAQEGENDFNFYPTPAPPMPEKNYDNNEVPLIMPPRP